MAIAQCCTEQYGFMPCSDTLGGNIALMAIYGYVLLIGAKLISDGSELLLEVLDPGLIGGLLLPILGALPDSFIIAMSGLGGSALEAQDQVSVGVGALAGSTIMLLTIAWGGSLLVGRCDIGVGGKSVDRQLSSSTDLLRTGVTTDRATAHNAWIMLATSLLYFVAQIPASLGDTQDTVISGIGTGFCFLALLTYCIYQVMVPELQKQRIKAARIRFVRMSAIRHVLNLSNKFDSGGLFKPDGDLDEKALSMVFKEYDTDSNGYIDKDELKKLVMTMTFGAQGFVPRDNDVMFYMQQFDMDRSNTISESEFIIGFKHWIKQTTPTPASLWRQASHIAALEPGNAEDLEPANVEEELGQALVPIVDEVEEELEEQAKDTPPTPAEITKQAVLLLVAGAVIIAAFSDPMVGTISSFAKVSGIPAFFVSFVVTPIASNASELYSSLVFAAKQRRRNISLTYSQVYGAVTMNNTLCLGVLLALVHFRNLTWDFSSEVTVVLLVVVVVGALASARNTFRSWLAFPVLALYPLSLLLVWFLDYRLGWH